MNYWTEESIKLANSKGYLDNLLDIYKITPNRERILPEGAKEKINELVKEGDAKKLVVYLLTLENFPIRIAYSASLRDYPHLIDKNPKLVNEIGKILFDMGTEKIIKGAKEPKIVSKQSGSMFSRWVKNQYTSLPEAEFESKSEGVVILSGSDRRRKEYANSKLNANIEEKGIDLLLKKGSKSVMGSAKFITAPGGGQDNQFYEVLRFVNGTSGSAKRIALLDGVIWFNDTYLEKIKASNKNIMSALLLKAFVDEL